MAQFLARRACDACGAIYQPARVTSKFCGDRCRKRAQRARLSKFDRQPRDDVSALPSTVRKPGPVTVAVLAELVAANRHDSALGQQCLYLAGRIDHGLAESGSALAALNRELRATRSEALAAVAGPGDALDEMARKREERLARARG